MIAEAKDILQTSPELPRDARRRRLTLLGEAVTLADHLLTIESAAILGKIGGKATAQRGAEYYRKISGISKMQAPGQAA